MSGSPQPKHGDARWGKVVTVDTFSRTPSKKRSSSRDWEPYRERIIQLYMVEKLTLRHVLQVLNKEFGLSCSASQLKRYLKQLGLSRCRRQKLYSSHEEKERSDTTEPADVQSNPENKSLGFRHQPDDRMNLSGRVYSIISTSNPSSDEPSVQRGRSIDELSMARRRIRSESVESYASASMYASRLGIDFAESPRKRIRTSSPSREEIPLNYNSISSLKERIDNIRRLVAVSSRNGQNAITASTTSNAAYIPPEPLRKEPISNTQLQAFHLAVLKGSADIIKILAGPGHANIINKKTMQDRTPLHLAVEKGHVEVVRVLLGFKDVIDLSVRDIDGLMPQHVAALKGDGEILRMLLEAGADPVAATKSGKTVMHILIDYDHDKLFLLFFSPEPRWRAVISAKYDHGWTLLHQAARKVKLDIAGKLIDFGASTNETAVFGHGVPLTPLHVLMAALFTRMDKDLTVPSDATLMLKLFLDSGATLNFMNMRLLKGRTLLHLTAKSGLGTILNQFLLHDSSGIDIPDDLDSTPLHYAVYSGMSKCAEVLLKNDADLTIPNFNGYNALHVATLRKDSVIMEKLLDAGADPNARDKDGRTALHLATMLDVDEDTKKIMNILMSARYKTDLEATILNDDYAAVDLFHMKTSEVKYIPDDDPFYADFPLHLPNLEDRSGSGPVEQRRTPTPGPGIQGSMMPVWQSRATRSPSTVAAREIGERTTLMGYSSPSQAQPPVELNHASGSPLQTRATRSPSTIAAGDITMGQISANLRSSLGLGCYHPPYPTESTQFLGSPLQTRTTRSQSTTATHKIGQRSDLMGYSSPFHAQPPAESTQAPRSPLQTRPTRSPSAAADPEAERTTLPGSFSPIHAPPPTESTPPVSHFSCQICGRGFTDRQNRTRHEREAHTIGNRHKCDVPGCKMSFSRLENLRRHKRRAHGDTKDG